jgi:hypothetical protein
MNELLGLGRTWWGFIVILVIATLMLGFGKMQPDVWQQVVTWTFAIAGGKSAVVGAAGQITINRNSEVKP